MIVQYNKFEFNDARIRAVPGEGGPRARDRRERRAEALAPQHPVFNSPNAIGRATGGLVQERGLYFLDTTRAIRSHPDLIGSPLRSPTNQAPSAARGQAKVGRGVDLRRPRLVGQLPAGTDAPSVAGHLISLP